MSTHVASSRPSTLRGLSSSASFNASSISSTIVRTRRVFDALTNTNTSAMERISPTSTTRMSSPFLSSAACAAMPARRWASEKETSEAAEGVKRQAPRSSAVSVDPSPVDLAHDVGGNQPVDRAALAQAFPQVGRGDVETRDGHPLHPPARSRWLRMDVAGPLDHDDRGQVTGLVEPPPGRHVRDRVGAED